MPPLYRNINAREQLEIFFVSAVSSLLLVRFYLHVADYPRVGGETFHIAHMLWGGLLMLIAIAIALSFIGRGAQRLTAFLGGIGFGIFIDEIGKFITSDNDYFFRPAVGIIYAIFVVLYLSFNFISRNTKLSSREYQLNALVQLEEALSHDMDRSEKQRVLDLLAQSDQNSEVTKRIRRMVDQIPTLPDPPKNIVARMLARADQLYKRFWALQRSNRYVRIFFIAQTGLFFIAVIFSFTTNINEVLDLYRGNIEYGEFLIVGEFFSSLIAALVAIKGAFVLKNSRLEAFELFRRATLINLLLTDFFTFSRLEFAALPGFGLNVLLLLLVTYVMHQENHHLRKPSKT